jgi:hypothetical protein
MRGIRVMVGSAETRRRICCSLSLLLALMIASGGASRRLTLALEFLCLGAISDESQQRESRSPKFAPNPVLSEHREKEARPHELVVGALVLCQPTHVHGAFRFHGDCILQDSVSAESPSAQAWYTRLQI